VEKLLASLAGQTNPTVERLHLDEVRRRRVAKRSSPSTFVDGDEALRLARTALGQ